MFLHTQAVPSYMRMDAKVRYPHLMLDPAEGFEKKFRNSRIHDGEDAEPGQFPFIVAVEMPLNSLGTRWATRNITTTTTFLETKINVVKTDFSR